MQKDRCGAPAALIFGVSLGITLFPGHATAQNAYVANNYADTITVIDMATDKVTATIPADRQPFGVALTPDGKRLFVTNQRFSGAGSHASTVMVFDTATNEDIATITLPDTGANATGVAISPNGNTVYVASGTNAHPEGNTVTVIDANTYEITATIPVPPEHGSNLSYPYALALTPGGEKLYVTDAYGDEVRVIDTASLEIVDSIYLNDGSRFASVLGAIAVTPDGKKVYVGGAAGPLAVIDEATGSFTFSPFLGSGFNFGALAVTPDGKKLIAASGQSVAYSLDIGTDTSLQNGRGSRISRRIFVEASPCGAAVTSDGKKAYVTNCGSNSVSVIDIAKNAVVATIRVGEHPTGIAIQSAPPSSAQKSEKANQ